MSSDAEDKAYQQFKGFLKKKKCCYCHAPGPSDMAHFMGGISPKTELPLPRSHKTMARWIAVPLCKECHQEGKFSIHEIGEQAFDTTMRALLGYGLANVSLGLLAEFNQTKLKVSGPKP